MPRTRRIFKMKSIYGDFDPRPNLHEIVGEIDQWGGQSIPCDLIGARVINTNVNEEWKVKKLLAEGDYPVVGFTTIQGYGDPEANRLFVDTGGLLEYELYKQSGQSQK